MNLPGESASDTNIPVVIHVVLDKNGKQIINTESVCLLIIKLLVYVRRVSLCQKL
jgi:hypothetical protein